MHPSAAMKNRNLTDALVKNEKPQNRGDETKTKCKLPGLDRRDAALSHHFISQALASLVQHVLPLGRPRYGTAVRALQSHLARARSSPSRMISLFIRRFFTVRRSADTKLRMQPTKGPCAAWHLADAVTHIPRTSTQGHPLRSRKVRSTRAGGSFFAWTKPAPATVPGHRRRQRPSGICMQA
jgi:hypothetical protein